MDRRYYNIQTPQLSQDQTGPVTPAGAFQARSQLPHPTMGSPLNAPVVPPRFLYHGTPRGNLPSIRVHGIKGRSEGWAYAAAAYEFARTHGKRRGGEHMVIRILPEEAHQSGTSFGLDGPS